MEWKEKLSLVPKNELGRKLPEEPIEREISHLFFKEEIYPRLESANKHLETKGFQTEIFPLEMKEISINGCTASITVLRHGNSNCFLKFESKKHFNIDVSITGLDGRQILGIFAIDREPESPVSFIESYINDFFERLDAS